MRNRNLLAMFATMTFVSAAFAAEAVPATQPPVEAKGDFPDWAMKAYPDDIVRLMRFDRVKDAEELGKKKLVELAKDPGKTFELIQTINSLSHLYLALNRVAEAQKLINNGRELLDKTKIEGADKEMDLARALIEDCQSSLAAAQGDTDRAAEYAKSVYDRLQKNLPPDDIRVIDQQLEMEQFKIRAADHTPVATAMRTFQRAINAYTKALGTRDCAPVADVYMSRGYYLLNNMQNVTQAENAFQASLEIRKKIYGENSEVGGSLQALALVASIKHDDDTAIKLLLEARAMVLKVIGESDPEVAGIDVLTASAYDRKDKPAEAEKLFLKAVGVFEKYQETKEDLADTLDLLSEHYRTHDQPDKADEAHDRAENIHEQLKKHQDL